MSKSLQRCFYYLRKLLRTPAARRIVPWLGVCGTASLLITRLIPNLPPRAPLIAIFFGLIAVLANVAQQLAITIQGERGTLDDVLRFRDNPLVITSSFKDSQGIWAVPTFDRYAAEKMQETMRLIGRKCVWDHCKSQALPHDLLDNDLVLICGPAMNGVSKAINEDLAAAPWYRGFFFSFKDSPDNNEPAVPEQGWRIKHRELGEMPYVPRILNDSEIEKDYALLYVGCHPRVKSLWLWWGAGLGPIATFGITHLLDKKEWLKQVGECLDISSSSYYSCLVEYTFLSSSPKRGEVKIISSSHGCVSEIALPASHS